MPPRKRQRTSTPRVATAAAAPSPTKPPRLTLPADLLLEIAARTDAATIFRFAAACKLLRREVLGPAFVRRVCRAPPDGGVVPSLSFLGFLGDSNSPFSLVHPATPAAASFAGDHLAPFVSRTAAGLLEQYQVVTSRGGLVVLQRREINRRRRSERRSDMCVYDPMTGARAFFSFPPDINRNPLPQGCVYTYVLLTAAADGIGCPFMLLAADMSSLLDCGSGIKVQTVSSDAGGGWGPAIYAPFKGPLWSTPVDVDNGAVVLGRVVHWLMHGEYILTYDVGTGRAGTIELPGDRFQFDNWRVWKARLRSSPPDGNALTLLFADQYRVFVWVLSASGGGGGWARKAVIDTAASLRSLELWNEDHGIKLQCCGDQRSGAVFLRVGFGLRGELLVLDMGTTEIRKIEEKQGIPYEVNLASQLASMKLNPSCS